MAGIESAGADLLLAYGRPEWRESAAGMLDEIDCDHLFMTLPTAVSVYGQWCGMQTGPEL